MTSDIFTSLKTTVNLYLTFFIIYYDCKPIFTSLKTTVNIVTIMFTVVSFGQVQSRKKRNVYSRLIWSSLFGHLY